MTLPSTALVMLFQFVSHAAYAFDDARPILGGGDLERWCKAKAELSFMQRDIPTFQWTATHRNQMGRLYVDGKLRVQGGKDMVVRCEIASGAPEGTASISINEP